MEFPNNKTELTRLLEELSRNHQAQRENKGSFRCESCEGCIDCQFCEKSTQCVGSSYLVSCVRCVDSTHSQRCEDLQRCSQCSDTKRCSNSAYLTLSEDCHHCTYCFGCVGLVRKDFHIFNQPYTRNEYFRKVAALKKTLGLS